jgi:hypothetical protein
VSRSTEKSIADFLATAELQPVGMILEGEAGIGKATHAPSERRGSSGPSGYPA